MRISQQIKLVYYLASRHLTLARLFGIIFLKHFKSFFTKWWDAHTDTVLEETRNRHLLCKTNNWVTTYGGYNTDSFCICFDAQLARACCPSVEWGSDGWWKLGFYLNHQTPRCKQNSVFVVVVFVFAHSTTRLAKSIKYKYTTFTRNKLLKRKPEILFN